jgi:hypothetical protein
MCAEEENLYLDFECGLTFLHDNIQLEDDIQIKCSPRISNLKFNGINYELFLRPR